MEFKDRIILESLEILLNNVGTTPAKEKAMWIKGYLKKDNPSSISRAIKEYREKFGRGLPEKTKEALSKDGFVVKKDVNEQVQLRHSSGTVKDESENWELNYCKKCIQMTNHKDGQCLKCSKKNKGELNK